MAIATDPLRVRLVALATLSPEHLDAIGRMQWLGLPRIVQSHAVLEEENEPAGSLFVVRRGWAFGSKLLSNGHRQIIDFMVAGDVVGCASAFLPFAQETSETVTETILTEIPVEAIKRMARQSPALNEALLALMARERVELAERLVDLGRRDSVARVAHLLLWLWRRLYVVGGATPTGYPCPLSQYLVADATGLTAIHVNRVLRELREAGLITFRHGYVKFHDFDRLVDMTGFDVGAVAVRPSYRRAMAKGAA